MSKNFDKSRSKDKQYILNMVKKRPKHNSYLHFQHADELLKNDKKYVLEVVRANGYSLYYADDSLKKDREFVLEVVKKYGLSLQYADDSLKKDREFVLEVVKKYGLSLKYADDSLKKDREIVLEAVKENGLSLQFADDSLKKDREIVLEAVKQKGYSLEFADDSLKKDREIVLEAVKQKGYSLEFADDSLKKDREFVLEAVKQNGNSLKYADDSLKKDREFVLEAVKQRGHSLQFADDSLKKDREFVLEVVKKYGLSLQYADDSLKKDREIVLEAVKENGLSLQFADDSLKKDREFVLGVVKQDVNLLLYADYSLKKDREFLLLLMEDQNPPKELKEDDNRVDVPEKSVEEAKREIKNKKKWENENQNMKKELKFKELSSKEIQNLRQANEDLKRKLEASSQEISEKELGEKKLFDEIVELKRFIQEQKRKNRRGIEALRKQMDRVLEIPLREFEEEKDDDGEKKCIGVGRFGEVFLYNWKTKSKKVAIKQLIKAIPMNIQDGFVTIQKEVKAVMWMRDPCILEVFGYVKFKQNEIGIVSEFMDGGSLKKISIHTLSPIYQWFIIKKMISAVEYLHSRGIIHRDIKPENYLVDKEVKIVKLCDFGLIKINEVGLTQTADQGKLRGSELYTPPEYLSSEEVIAIPYALEGDIWSLGISFLEILQGKHPFKSRGHNLLLLFSAIKQAKVEIPDHIHPLFQEIIQSCLQKDKRKRKSASEMLTFLEQHEEKFFKEIKSPNEKFEGIKALVDELSNSILHPFYHDDLVKDNCTNGLNYLHQIEEFVAKDRSLKIVDILRSVVDTITNSYDKYELDFAASFALSRFLRRILELTLIHQAKTNDGMMKQEEFTKIELAVQKIWKKNESSSSERNKKRVRQELELIKEGLKHRGDVKTLLEKVLSVAKSDSTKIEEKIKEFENVRFLHIIAMRILCWKVLDKNSMKIERFLDQIQKKVDFVVVIEIVSMLSKLCIVWTTSKNQEKSFEKLLKFCKCKLYKDSDLNSLVQERARLELKRVGEYCNNKILLEKIENIL